MTNQVVAVLGISGVGKSTFLTKLSETLNFQHLQASELIQLGRRHVSECQTEVDNLRNLNIDENQEFLIYGFNAMMDKSCPLVVLDGHSVIDTPNGFVNISPQVFRNLKISNVIYLIDDAIDIEVRRAFDGKRNRLRRSLEQLKKYQEISLLSASETCLDLDVPLTVIKPTKLEYANKMFLDFGAMLTRNNSQYCD
jgi:adenylate kinase